LAAAGAAATEHSEESAHMEGTEANTSGRLHIESGKPMNMFQAQAWPSTVVQFLCDDYTPNWDRPRRIGMRELSNYLTNREELEYTNEVQKTLSTTAQQHGNCNQSCAATEHAAIAVLPASTTATTFNLSVHLRVVSPVTGVQIFPPLQIQRQQKIRCLLRQLQHIDDISTNVETATEGICHSKQHSHSSDATDRTHR